MAIHLDRNNMLFGTGEPKGKISPAYYGQVYIDTATNPRNIWISTGQFSDSWGLVSQDGHLHTPGKITGLREEIKNIINEEGIEAAIIALMSASNTWEGPVNNFTGSLRKSGSEVLNTQSSIDDLKDVKTGNKKVGSLLGWNGSHFIPYEVKGATPETGGGIDFGQYLRKDSLINDINSSDTTAPLAASAGKKIMDSIKAKYAPINHTHTEYAAASHTHSNYADLNKNIEFEHQLNITGTTNTNPLNLSSGTSKIGFYNAPDDNGYAKIAFSKQSGKLGKAIIGGEDGAAGEELILNFGNITIPTGGFRLAENKKFLPMPAMKIPNQNSGFVGHGNARTYGLNLDHNAIVGVGQLAFQKPAQAQTEGILFPKSYAGNTQPSELGFYHHLRLIDGEMKTDTALASEAKYFSLGGRKIFFSPSDPGKEAREGDIWFAI